MSRESAASSPEDMGMKRDAFEQPRELSNQEKAGEMFEQLKGEYGQVPFETFMEHAAKYHKVFKEVAGDF